jgi:hypothetical protein
VARAARARRLVACLRAALATGWQTSVQLGTPLARAARRTSAVLASPSAWARGLAWLRSLLLTLLVLEWLLARVTRHLVRHRVRDAVIGLRGLRSATTRARVLAAGGHLAALARRAPWRLRAALRRAYQTTPIALDDLESDTPDTLLVWERRLSGRARLARLVVIGGSLCLALFLITGGPAAALAEWRQVSTALTPPHPLPATPAHLNASFWVAGRMPLSAIFAHGVQLQPSQADSGVAYACWVTRDSNPAHLPTLNLYATYDGARNWVSLAVPEVPAAACRLATDGAEPQRVLLLLIPPDSGACATPRAFDTPDGGATWTPVPLPAAILATCDITFALWHDAIYLWSPTAQTQLLAGPAAQLLTSSNDGATWYSAFDAPASGTVVTLVSGASNGGLMVLVSPAASQGRDAVRSQATLWCRATAGAPWQSLGPLPDGTSAAYVVLDAQSPPGCAFATIYAAGFLARDDPTVTRIEVDTGGRWRIVPALAAPDGSADFPLGDDGHVLGVGPSGMLLTDTPYTGAEVGLAAGGYQQARAIWGWDPRTGRWLPDFHPTPANSSIEGLAWDHSPPSAAPRLIFWIYTLNAGVPAFTGVMRATFAVASAPAQDAYAIENAGP